MYNAPASIPDENNKVHRSEHRLTRAFCSIFKLLEY